MDAWQGSVLKSEIVKNFMAILFDIEYVILLIVCKFSISNATSNGNNVNTTNTKNN